MCELIVLARSIAVQVVHLDVCSVLPDPKRRGIDIMQGDAAVGKIVLQTRSTPIQVKQLRSVQALLAFLTKSDEIVTDDAQGVDQIAVRACSCFHLQSVAVDV